MSPEGGWLTERAEEGPEAISSPPRPEVNRNTSTPTYAHNPQATSLVPLTWKISPLAAAVAPRGPKCDLKGGG